MKLLNSEGKQIEKVDFGVVEAGKQKTVLVTLFNDDISTLTEIEIKTNHQEVELSNVPTTVDSREKKEFKLTWKPSVNIKKGLIADIIIKCSELWS